MHKLKKVLLPVLVLSAAALCSVGFAACHEHTWVIDESSVTATCTEGGTADYYCECGEHKQENVAALGHDWEDAFTVDAPATCTDDGSKSIHCKNCNETKDETPVPAGHVWEDDYTVDTPATCTDDGSKSVHCANCDEKKDVTTVPASHTWNPEYEVDIPMSCFVNGSESIHCMECGAIKDETSRLILAPMEHDWDDQVTAITIATCTENGEGAIYCKLCALMKEESETVLPALDHDWGDWQVKPATCDDASETYRVCKHDAAHIDVDDAAESTPATGHEWGEWVVVKEPTESETGTVLRRCTHDKHHSEHMTIPKLSDTAKYDSVTGTDSTCDEPGQLTYTISSLNYRAYGQPYSADSVLSYNYSITVDKPVAPHVGEYVYDQETKTATLTCTKCHEVVDTTETVDAAMYNPTTDMQWKVAGTPYKMEPGNKYFVFCKGNVEAVNFDITNPGTYVFTFDTLTARCLLQTGYIAHGSKTNSNATATQFFSGNDVKTTNLPAGFKCLIETDGRDPVASKCSATKLTIVLTQEFLDNTTKNKDNMLCFSFGCKTAGYPAMIVDFTYSESTADPVPSTPSTPVVPEDPDTGLTLKAGENTVKVTEANVTPAADTEGWVYTLNASADDKKSIIIDDCAGLKVYLKVDGAWTLVPATAGGKIVTNFEIWEGEATEFYFSGEVKNYTVKIGNPVDETREKVAELNKKIEMQFYTNTAGLQVWVSDNVVAGTYKFEITSDEGFLTLKATGNGVFYFAVNHEPLHNTANDGDFLTVQNNDELTSKNGWTADYSDGKCWTLTLDLAPGDLLVFCPTATSAGNGNEVNELGKSFNIKLVAAD